MVADLRPGPDGSCPTFHARAGNKLYFTADDGVHGRELWILDIPESLEAQFLRGDADSSGNLSLNDALRILDVLFRGVGEISCPDAADADDNGEVSVTDVVYLLTYLFLGGLPPAEPGPNVCGADRSEDVLPVCEQRVRPCGF